AKSLGKGIVEFKKGVKGIEDEVHSAEYAQPSPPAADPHQGGGSGPAPSGGGSDHYDQSDSPRT
ncbi:MAG: hypothetical protein AAF488_06170, partial [Planctomycetota bacterium]